LHGSAHHGAPIPPIEQEALKQRRQSERRPPSDASVTSLFVGGVPPSVDKKELLPYFLAYGEVRACSARLIAPDCR